jgi:hypothetical protein
VVPNIDGVYIGDFDQEFTLGNFWSYKDDATVNWSIENVGKAAITLAQALHSLATGGQDQNLLNVNVAVRFDIIRYHTLNSTDCPGVLLSARISEDAY